MNIIDQAILISASPGFIWRFVGDLSKNVDWQEGQTHISFLTTRHEGKGTRWRYSTANGHDVIAEIVAWYDTLGYEYQIVDGAQFSSNLGRIRLQEIAEGTRVRWTFQYEPGGVFGGLRHSMGRKRSIANGIQDSLRNLHKLIQEETGGISTHEAKASLKEAPDVEERSSYQPRHPSSFVDEAMEAAHAESEQDAKQPIAYALDHETRPAPAAADDDTQPNPVVQAADAASDPIAPMIPPAEELSQEKQTSAPAKAPRDTADVSVFDVFGLQKPSETEHSSQTSPRPEAQDLAVSAAESDPETLNVPMEEAEAAAEMADILSEAEPPLMTGGRIEIQLTGWRRIARRRQAGLRQRH